MRLEYLREFLSVAESKNYMESAESQFVSQAALSRHIQALEEEMKIDLLNRSTRKVSLTEAGQRVRPFAQQLVDLYDEMNNEIAKYRPEGKKVLSVGYSNEIRLTNLLNILEDYREKAPDVEVTLSAADQGSAARMILRRTLDCSCVSEEELVEDSRLGKIRLLSDRLVAVVPKGHPWENNTRIGIEQLCREKLVLYHANYAVNNILTKAFNNAGLRPDIALYTTLGRDVLRMVVLGMGIGVTLKRGTAIEEYANKVSILDLDPSMEVKFYFIYNNRNISDPLSSLIDAVKNCADGS